MKTRVVSALMAVAVASITASAVTVDKQIPSVKAIRAIAAETSVVELPAKAAKIVAEASEENREKIAIRTVRIFLQNHHSLAPSLVGAIANTSPEVAAAVAAEAISLFPENAYSITKAAVAAAPKHALQIALRAAKLNRNYSKQISAGVERAIPTEAPHYRNVLTALSAGDRVESAELGVFTVKVRIGTSSSNIPADLKNPTLNIPGEDNQQQVFSGVTQTTVEETVTDEDGNPVLDEDGNEVKETVLVFTVDTGEVDLPENLEGQEVNDFDIISRLLDTTNEFVKEVVIEEYVQ